MPKRIKLSSQDEMDIEYLVNQLSPYMPNATPGGTLLQYFPMDTQQTLINSQPFGQTRTETEEDNEKSFSKQVMHGRNAPVYHKKKKVIKNSLKGVSRKLAKKVKKVMAHTGVFSVYKYISCIHLRQVTVDVPALIDADVRGEHISFGDTRTVYNAWQILFAGTNPNWDVSQTPPPITGPVEIINAGMEFFFKSTSGHVVNIEVFECIYMKPTSLTGKQLSDNSYNDYVANWTADIGGVRTITAEDTNLYGFEASQWTSLHQMCKVICHRVKLLPGESANLSVKLGRHHYDMSKIQDVTIGGTASTPAQFSNPYYFPPGSKNFFFRVINDISVSTPAGAIHHWPSNAQGGVACEYTRWYKFQPNLDANIDAAGAVQQKDKISIGMWIPTNVSGQTDQQVAVANPVEKADPTA